MLTVHLLIDVAEVLRVVLPAGQEVQVGLGLRVVPPVLYVPLGHGEQVVPPKPGMHTAMLQAATPDCPMDLVVKLAGQEEHAGFGTLLLPPIEYVPIGQGVQLFPPRPAVQMVTVHALAESAPW